MRTVLFDDSPTGVLALLIQKMDDRIDQLYERRQHEQSALLDQKIDDRINQWFERRQHEQSTPFEQKIDDWINQWFERRRQEQSASALDEVSIHAETKLDVDSTDRRGRDEVHMPKLDVDSSDPRGALSGRDVVDISSDESELDGYSSDDDESESEASFFVKKSATVHLSSDENRCAACSRMKVEVEPLVFIHMKKEKEKEKEREKEKEKEMKTKMMKEKMKKMR